jgi:hypothetical protein
MTGKTMAREAVVDAASSESSATEMDAAGAETTSTTPQVEAATTAMEATTTAMEATTATAAAVSAPTAAAVSAGRRIARRGCSQRPAGQKSESKFAFKFSFHVTPLFDMPHLPHVWRHPSKTRTPTRQVRFPHAPVNFTKIAPWHSQP